MLKYAMGRVWEVDLKVKCGICGHLMFVEDSQTCQICGKSVCQDCSTVQKLAEDDWMVVCISCLELENERR